MTKIKKVTASCIAALCIAGSLSTGAYAATTSHDWSALGRYVVGAPSSVNSEPDIFTIYHGKSGATATMKDVTRTIPGSTATTTIYCLTYSMQFISFKDYYSESKPLKPDVGNPIVDIPVKYEVNASTNTVGDTVVTTGRIKKA